MGMLMGGLLSQIIPEPLNVYGGPNLSGAGVGPAASGNVTTSQDATTNTSGGTPPYTWLWEIQGTPATSGPYDIAPSSTDETPFWSKVVFDSEANPTETWKVTVTDFNLDTDTDTITVTLTWTDNR